MYVLYCICTVTCTDYWTRNRCAGKQVASMVPWFGLPVWREGQEVDVDTILSLVEHQILVENFNILLEEERRQGCKSGERKNRSSILFTVKSNGLF